MTLYFQNRDADSRRKRRETRIFQKTGESFYQHFQRASRSASKKGKCRVVSRKVDISFATESAESLRKTLSGCFLTRTYAVGGQFDLPSKSCRRGSATTAQQVQLRKSY